MRKKISSLILICTITLLSACEQADAPVTKKADKQPASPASQPLTGEALYKSDKAPDWFNQLRAQGVSRFTELGIPTTKDEEWKYTNLSGLAALKFDIPKESKLAEPGSLQNYCSSKDI